MVNVGGAYSKIGGGGGGRYNRFLTAHDSST